MTTSRPGAIARRLPFHYAWLIVAVAALMSAVTSSIRLSFGVFLDPLHAQFGWSRAEMSLAYSIQFGTMAVMAVVVGWLVSRFGAKKCLLVGGAGFSIAITLTGFSTRLWQLYLFYGLLLGAAMSCFVTPLHSTTSLWFRRRIGLAIGLIMAFQALGPLFGAPVYRYLAETVGWQQSFYISGVLSAVALLIAGLLFKNRPEDIGVRPYAEDRLSIAQLEAAKAPTVDGQTLLKRAVRTQPFWITIFTHLTGCVSHAIPLVFVVSMATLKGIDGVIAATLLGTITATGMISNLSMSVLAEHLGGRRVLIFVLAIQSTAILFLLGATELWQFYLFAVLFGLGYGGEMVVYPMINRQYYGNAPFVALYGWQMAGASLGMALGGYFGGLFFEATGDYSVSIWLAVGAGYVGLLAALIMHKPNPKGMSAPDPVTDQAGEPVASSLDVAATAVPTVAVAEGSPGNGAGRPEIAWGEWLARRHGLESGLAQALDVWAQREEDPELAETLEIASARSRDRAFRLRRAGATNGASPQTSGSDDAIPDLTSGSAADHLDRLVALLEQDATAGVVPPDPAAAALLEQLRGSTMETADLLREQRDRLRPPAQTAGVRLLEGHRPRVAAGGQVGWKLLAHAAPGGAAVLWVWQRPGSRIRWDAGQSRVVVPLEGCGRVVGPPEGELTLVRQQPVDIGPAATVEVTAGGDLPLSYLLIAPDIPPLPAILAARPAVQAGTRGFSPAVNGHDEEVANGHAPVPSAVANGPRTPLPVVTSAART